MFLAAASAGPLSGSSSTTGPARQDRSTRWPAARAVPCPLACLWICWHFDHFIVLQYTVGLLLMLCLARLRVCGFAGISTILVVLQYTVGPLLVLCLARLRSARQDGNQTGGKWQSGNNRLSAIRYTLYAIHYTM